MSLIAANTLVSANSLTVEDGTVTAATVNLNVTNVSLRAGSGSPEGAVTGAVGSLWVRTDGGTSTTLYVKETGSGNTGWVAK